MKIDCRTKMCEAEGLAGGRDGYSRLWCDGGHGVKREIRIQLTKDLLHVSRYHLSNSNTRGFNIFSKHVGS